MVGYHMGWLSLPSVPTRAVQPAAYWKCRWLSKPPWARAVRSGSGGIHLSGSSGQLELHAASGGVELTGRHEQVNTNVSSGRTSLKGTFGELAVKSASGGVSVRCLSQPRSIRAGTSSGSLTITLPRELSGMRLNVRTGSGKLTNDFESDRFGDEALSVDLHAASGNIHIEKQ